MIEDAVKAQQTINEEWEFFRDLIEGVQVKEVKNVPTSASVITEVFRTDWDLHDREIQQIIHVSFYPGIVCAWHCHQFQTDHLACVHGSMKVVLYDDREESPTRGRTNIFRLSPLRPALVVIPPLIWHGFQNTDRDVSIIVNFFDRAFDYADPDEWRLPADSPKIPYEF